MKSQTERLHFHFSLSCIGEGNGNPLQCSCLENPRDGGAWWAAVYGVTQSQTQLKWLSSSIANPYQRLLDDQVHCQWMEYFQRKLFWAVALNIGLKIFSKPCCKQIGCHPSFVVPLTEYRQSRFNMILKGPRSFRIVSEHWLQLKVTSCTGPSKRVSLSFEVLKADIDFSLDMIVLDGIFL